MRNTGSSSSTRRLQFLDIAFDLHSDAAAGFSTLDTLYDSAEFAPSGKGPVIAASFHVAPPDPALRWVESEGSRTPLGTTPDGPLELAEWVFRRFLRASRDYLLVHAAAAAYRGQGLILVGPPFAGKTTLSVALSATGMEYYSDDVGAISRSSGDLHPFRRRAGVRRTQGGRDYVTPGGASDEGSRVPPPRPLRWIFVLDAPQVPRPGEPAAWSVILGRDSERLLPVIEKALGRSAVSRIIWGGGLRADFVLVAGRDLAVALGETLGDPPRDLLYLGPTPRDWTRTPAREPVLEPLVTGQATEEILRHLLNRSASGDLEKRFGSHPHLRLLSDLLAILAPARVMRLTPGTPEATAHALRNCIDLDGRGSTGSPTNPGLA